jgi:F-type H+-transporting ATPase subunit delta
MMRKVLFTGLQKASYSSSARVMAEAAAATNSQLVLNFCTPHAAVFNKKVIDQVILPGSAGVYGITQGHAPIISQLDAGVVTVMHVGVRN